MIRVSIPSYRQVERQNEDHFTVYLIELSVSGRQFFVEKRYSELEKLHQHLKTYIHTPDFPPKKIFKTNSKVLEQRRLGLQTYLQQLSQRHKIPKSLLRFFHINYPESTGSFDSLDGLDQDSVTTHQPLVVFSGDPYLRSSNNASTDIVVDGVLQCLYGDDALLPL